MSVSWIARPPRSRTEGAARFAVVGASGILVNQAVLMLATELAGIHYLASAVIATQASTTWNFLWVDRWAFSGRRTRRGPIERLAGFLLLNNSTLLARVPILWLLTEGLGVHYAVSNVLSLAALWLLRFLISDAFIWRLAGPDGPAGALRDAPPGVVPLGLGQATWRAGDTIALAATVPAAIGESRPQAVMTGPSNGHSHGPTNGHLAVPSQGRTNGHDRSAAGNGHRREPVAVGPGRPARYRYDIGGIVRLDSDAELPELGFFRTETLSPPDIRVVIGRVGSLPSRQTRFIEEGDRLRYLEHLGALGANFELRMGEPIEIRVAPLLALSRHVLYTNIIEAFLRFAFVSKGYVLLHSACLAAEGQAVVLSAQTDTGKTSTVIQLVRERGYRFLSDDMTILGPDGDARCYPKPMTLSYHTMSAINGRTLPAGRRAKLALQSRLHSKSGRSVGRAMGRMNIPIMSVNSAVQLVVPPPKYRIETLIECQIQERAPIGHVILMERGESARAELQVDEAIDTLIENTDDAYGFPPFATFAPHIRINGQDYTVLRRLERTLLAAALRRARIVRLRVPGHEWAELLPDIIREPWANSADEGLPVATAYQEIGRTRHAAPAADSLGAEAEAAQPGPLVL